jgi:ribosomal protein S27E
MTRWQYTEGTDENHVQVKCLLCFKEQAAPRKELADGEATCERCDSVMLEPIDPRDV